MQMRREDEFLKVNQIRILIASMFEQTKIHNADSTSIIDNVGIWRWYPIPLNFLEWKVAVFSLKR